MNYWNDLWFGSKIYELRCSNEIEIISKDRLCKKSQECNNRVTNKRMNLKDGSHTESLFGFSYSSTCPDIGTNSLASLSILKAIWGFENDPIWLKWESKIKVRSSPWLKNSKNAIICKM